VLLSSRLSLAVAIRISITSTIMVMLLILVLVLMPSHSLLCTRSSLHPLFSCSLFPRTLAVLLSQPELQPLLRNRSFFFGRDCTMVILSLILVLSSCPLSSLPSSIPTLHFSISYLHPHRSRTFGIKLSNSHRIGPRLHQAYHARTHRHTHRPRPCDHFIIGVGHNSCALARSFTLKFTLTIHHTVVVALTLCPSAK
jgi:hypothetical protein